MMANTNQSQDQGSGATQKFADASQTFSEALRRILQAASNDGEGGVCALSQTQLAEASGVSRQALVQYLAARKDKPANPTLETLCHLAHTLGVPPAFLLMTAEDWTRLAHAVNYYTTALQDPRFWDLAHEVTHPRNQANHQEIAEAGLKMARMLGLIQRANVDLMLDPGTSQRASIAVTCLAPPISSLDLNFRPTLLTLCAIIGASTAH